MKKGWIIIAVILFICIINSIIFFNFFNKKEVSKVEDQIKNKSESQNTTQKENDSISEEIQPDYKISQFKLAFYTESSRNPYEKIFVGEGVEDSKIQEYTDAIQKTRKDLKNFINRAESPDLIMSFEQKDQIGFDSTSLHIMTDSNVKMILLNPEISGNSVSFTPEIKYTNKNDSGISEEPFSIDMGQSKSIWVARIGWKNENSSTEPSPMIILYSDLDKEAVQGEYDGVIKIELKNTTTSTNTSIESNATIRVFTETDITMPTENITLNESELEKAIDSEQQIIFLGADWIIKHIDNSCKGIEYPGISNIGIAEYISSSLNSAISDPDFPKKERGKCPLKEITGKKPKAIFVKND